MSFSFYGMNRLNLDERGRIGVPTRYREELRDRSASKVWVTIGPEPSEKRLLIYPDPEWREVEARLQRQDNSKPGVRHVQRRMIGHASEAELDRNSRVLVPQVLREYAGLDKKVVFVGQGRKFELWSEAVWEEVMTRGDDQYAGMDGLDGFRY